MSCILFHVILFLYICFLYFFFLILYSIVFSCQVFGFEVFSEQQLLVLNDPTRARAFDTDLVALFAGMCFGWFWAVGRFVGWRQTCNVCRLWISTTRSPDLRMWMTTGCRSQSCIELLLSNFAGFASAFAPYFETGAWRAHSMSKHVQTHVVFTCLIMSLHLQPAS